MTPEQVLWSRVERRGPDECWPWVGALSHGYGVFIVNWKRYRAHRLAYELLVGPIPDGLVIDHLCRNPPCCNPAHLEPVTNKDNILRGTSPQALNSRKLNCPKGHPLTGNNVYLTPLGYRDCRQCKRDRRPAEEMRRSPRLPRRIERERRLAATLSPTTETTDHGA